jgi:predicted GIY-YIG superfamily endonuclease
MLARCSLAIGFLLFWTTFSPISARPGVRADEPSAKKNSSGKTPAAKRSLKAKDDADEKDSAARQQLVDVVTAAFREVHDGWSTDDVVLKDDLNQDFLAKCKEKLPDATAADCNWTLLNLRKAGRLGVVARKRERTDHDDYQHAAEIAARHVMDKYEQSIDRLLCDPERRAEFDKVAVAVAPDVEPYQLRKAAFGLRKARRLQPELVVRVADWDKEVLQLSAADIVSNGELVSDAPGIYIFRDSTGYLYIGESSSLKHRVNQHLDHSDRKSLAHYLWEKGNREITVELHVFSKDSPARNTTRRRAYESELIKSRKPRFNIAP